jgi:hypothetical protein
VRSCTVLLKTVLLLFIGGSTLAGRRSSAQTQPGA